MERARPDFFRTRTRAAPCCLRAARPGCNAAQVREPDRTILFWVERTLVVSCISRACVRRALPAIWMERRVTTERVRRRNYSQPAGYFLGGGRVVKHKRTHASRSDGKPQEGKRRHEALRKMVVRRLRQELGRPQKDGPMLAQWSITRPTPLSSVSVIIPTATEQPARVWVFDPDDPSDNIHSEVVKTAEDIDRVAKVVATKVSKKPSRPSINGEQAGTQPSS
jgi:hypothetical protein